MQTPNTLNIAHRGARSLAPENTLAAAQAGLDSGAHMWELDVALSADGIPVVIHDDTLERTSNAAQVYPGRAPWLVHAFTLAELRALDFGGWFVQQDPFRQIAAGAISPTTAATYHGLKIPTLQEALAFTRAHRWRVNVEIKDLSATPGGAQVVAKVAELVDSLDMVEQVLVSSFQHDDLRAIKRLAPAIHTAALTAFPIADAPALLRELGAQAYHPIGYIVNPELVQTLRGQGFDVNVWTVNEVEDMRALVAMGVSAIFTDFPQRLAQVLSEPPSF